MNFMWYIAALQAEPGEGFYVSWQTVGFLLLLGFFILVAWAVYHLVQTLRQVRETMATVEQFLHQSDEIVRNLKSITYKLDRQLEDTGVVTAHLRKSTEEVSHALSLLGRFTGRPVSALLSILGPLWLWKRREKKKKD